MSFKIQTLSSEGAVLFTTTRKTRAAAERYAAAVEAKPQNVKYGVTTAVSEVADER